ncbi:DUF5776 domain-containing protein [Lentilactobacillus fungorum]|nr:DUF5776 domain-containing protein [Lentilactobacillus fungorum]
MQNRNNYGFRQQLGRSSRYLASILLAAVGGWMLLQSPVASTMTLTAAAATRQAVQVYVQPQYQLDRDGSWEDIPGTGPIAVAGTVGQAIEAPAIKDYVPITTELAKLPSGDNDQAHPIRLKYRKQSTGLYTATVNINYIDQQKETVISTDTRTLHYTDKVTIIPKAIKGYQLRDVRIPDRYFAQNLDKSVNFTFKELRDPTYTVNFYYVLQSIHPDNSDNAETKMISQTAVKPQLSSQAKPDTKVEPVEDNVQEKPVYASKKKDLVVNQTVAVQKEIPESKEATTHSGTKSLSPTTDAGTAVISQPIQPAKTGLASSAVDQKSTVIINGGEKQPVIKQKGQSTPQTQGTSTFEHATGELRVNNLNSKPLASVEPKITERHAETSNQPSKVAVKGLAVYAIRKINLYRSANFSQSSRRFVYSKVSRPFRPMFVVIGYARSNDGKLRYRVRDVNHLSRTAGNKGYITTDLRDVRPVYDAYNKGRVVVINPSGINAYRLKNLTGKLKHYQKGTILKPRRIVNFHLTTRYVLSDGSYITANRKLVAAHSN